MYLYSAALLTAVQFQSS